MAYKVFKDQMVFKVIKVSKEEQHLACKAKLEVKVHLVYRV